MGGIFWIIKAALHILKLLLKLGIFDEQINGIIDDLMEKVTFDF